MILTPVLVTTTALGTYNTHLSVVLPLAAVQIPFTVLLARNFVDGIPDDLIDAARVDRETTWKAFGYIWGLFPFPVGAAIIVLKRIGTWSVFFLPLVFLQTSRCRR